jgi:hypothetical protein
MAVLELYGKCKELGYCDCGGFLGCNDPDHVGGRLSPSELDAARTAAKAEAMGEGHRKYDANEPLVAMVECEVCDRSHAPNHPHIANIDGDVPIDDSELDDALEPQPTTSTRELPDWLKDKPGSHAIRPAADTAPNKPTCGVCGELWASRHVCKGAEQPGTSAFDPPIGAPGSRRTQNLCEVCGKVKRSNHNCKGAQPAEKPCVYCVRAGEPCVRHGGERSSVRASKRYNERQKAVDSSEPSQLDSQKIGFYGTQPDERVAQELPKPMPMTQRVQSEAQELDRELSAIGTILASVDGLSVTEVKRVLAYVADRKGIKQETES